MLSPDEKISIIEEAQDAKRREVFRRFRRPAPSPAVFLDALTGAAELFRPFVTRWKRKRVIRAIKGRFKL